MGPRGRASTALPAAYGDCDGRMDVKALAVVVTCLALIACGSSVSGRPGAADVAAESRGEIVQRVVSEQPWLEASSDDATFSPDTSEEQYMVVTAVADAMFGARYVGGQLDGQSIRLAVVDATDADSERLRQELATDDRLREAAGQFTLVPVERTATELRQARDDILSELPDELRDRISVSLDLAEGRVTVYAVDEKDADAVRQAAGELPEFVTIVVDSDREISPASG